MPDSQSRPHTRPLLPLWAALLASAVAGPTLDLAYPSVGWWPLAFVGIAFSLIALVGRSVWGSLFVGFVFGASFYLVHIEWITRYLGVVPWFALAGLESILMAVGSVLLTLVYRWFPRAFPSRWARLVGLPALIGGVWTLREIVMGSWPYTGFPWARIGMSQSESPLAHIASWVGVSGLSFLMVVATAAVIEAVRGGAIRDLRRLIPAAAIVLVLVATPQYVTTDAGEMRVGSVQGNGPSGYFDSRSANSVLSAQIDASSALFGEEMDVLLWPEGGIDSDPTTSPSTAAALDQVAEEVDAPLIVNAATVRGDDIFNTSMLWIGGEGAVQVHDKTHPVPFGEYVPDRWFFRALAPDLIDLIQREYTPGTNSPTLDVNGTTVGLAICFDVIYDDVVWEGAEEGAEVYMFQTNNADFRDTDENLQQLAFARMRAIETGRSVVNISTVGTSQVIAPDGTVIDGLPAGEAGAMLTDVPLRIGLTPAVVLGGWVQAILAWGSFIAVLALGVLVRRRRHIQ
ncbi:apolipoprotein N-acyltransferase [Microbacterium endophyticum]|uniref:Apolipoprotein N-acyltransferase n=1 Tax=Microbacterium endophyticum TaxID=1526412 RepID=A0A7W4V4K5_9MICO|nr:apolipoprotein N-acyltransferase [Microbacterium endophyticum]MBB2976725.1 apolipoprotein N-acyltransferase [Microbacterium endophyticum]NIK36639.1 apolipoprotein N-acyltransferase [Microbacterium endophyticum]